jgi:hypothetical protein
MTDERRRRVFVGYLPTADVTFVAEGEVDPVARLIADANAKLDAERAEAERVRLAALADIERAKRTKRARLVRRFGRALKALMRS